jgi:tetratricopeptide (TPR) repeat protein
VSERTIEQPVHGETIAPLERAARSEARAPVARARPARASWWPALALIALVVLAGVVFGVLPRWGAEHATPPRAAAPAPTDESSAPELSPEEIEALKNQGESLLAELLPQQARVKDLHPQDWAADDWAHYQELGRSGDDAYLATDYRAAVDAYGAAVALGRELLTRASDLSAAALAAGENALAAGDPERAADQFNVVLGIDPDQSEARKGIARAERLPEVLDRIERASALEAAGKLDEAIKLYREAAAIDPAYEPAREAVDRVAKRSKDEQFERLMSQGLAALGSEEFDTAHKAFAAALAIRPTSPAAKDGLDQADLGQSLDAIALAEARALAFERRELWRSAIEQYRAALATDDTLDFARQGLARAEARADLDAKLENLIANPNLLFRDDILSQAGELLASARAVEAPGARITAQATELARLIDLASTPVSVELKSDQKTEVTLYRVGSLGAFDVKEVELRPGTYTAVGSRSGYRDVRRTFTVLPGHELEPITVQCVEPI